MKGQNKLECLYLTIFLQNMLISTIKDKNRAIERCIREVLYLGTLKCETRLGHAL
jgi:hypothetical protein